MNFIEDLIARGERRRLFWWLQCGGWLGLGVLAVFFSVSSYFELRDAVYIGIFRTGLGFGVSSLLWLGYRRLRRAGGSLWWRGLGVFLVCSLAGGMDGWITGVFVKGIGVDVQSEGVQGFLLLSPVMRSLLYLFWSVLYFSINYWLDTQQTQLRLARAQAAARTSELRALRAQINPHFLFNALGSILAQSENPSRVRQITFSLSDYLRFSLQQHGEFEPLGAELKALENYLQVEKTRFEENLEYRIDAGTEARAVAVPNAIVQPLLENAIKYGQHASLRPVRVSIAAMVAAETLVITVANSGGWVAPEQNESPKIGLSNLRRRLQLLYGGRATLTIDAGAGAVSVCVRLPLQVPLAAAAGEREPLTQKEG